MSGIHIGDIYAVIRLKDELSPALRAAAESAKKAGQDFEGLGRSATSSSVGIGQLEASLTRAAAAGTAIGSIFARAATSVVKSIADFGAEAVTTAARTESLVAVAQFLGQRSGATRAEVDGLITSLKHQGITTQESAQLVTQLARQNLGLENATKLAAAAQNAAFISGMNSSEALQRIITGIVTLQPEMIRTAGLTINLGVAEATWAKAHHRAAETLTASEKQHIALNAVLKEAEKINGTYALSMGFVGKQITSLPRFIEEAKNAIGEQFLPVLRESVTVFTTLLKAIAQHPAAFTALTGSLVALAAPLAIAKTTALLGIPALTGLASAALMAAPAFSGMLSSVSNAQAGVQLIGEAAGITVGRLGVLGSAAAVAGAAFIGWQIGRLIAELTGLDEAIAGVVKRIGLFQHGAELAKVQQDVITGAIARGAAESTTYAQALEFNVKWAKEHAFAFKQAAPAVTALTNAQKLAAALAELHGHSIAKLSAEAKTLANAVFRAGGSVSDALKALTDSTLATKDDEVAVRALHETYAKGKHVIDEVAKAHKEARLALIPLTDAQQKQAIGLLELGLSHEVIGREIRASTIQVKEFEAALKATNERIHESRQLGREAIHAVIGSLGPQSVLKQLSQTMGDSLLNFRTQMVGYMAGPMPDLSGSVYNEESVKGRMARLKDYMGPLLSSVRDVAAEIPKILVQAFTGGGGLSGAASAIGSMLGATVGKVIGGSVKALGRLGGPLGEALGSLVGPAIQGLIALFGHHVEEDIAKLGKAWGVTLSDSLKKTIVDQTKSMFGGSEVAAMQNNLKAIIGEAGGLNADNLEKWTSKLRDTFSLIEQHHLTIAQGAKIIDENWAAFVAAGTDGNGRLSDSLREIIRLNDRVGTQSKQIAEYLKQQGTNAITGFVAVVAGTADAVATYDALKKAVDEATKSGVGLTEALTRQFDAAQLATGELADLGIQAVASYTAAVAAGLSEAEALKAIHPALATLRKSYADLGLDVDSVALKALLLKDTVVTNNPALVAAVAGLSQELIALDNMGLLNIDTFGSMERTGAAMYVRLQAAAAAAGGGTRDALEPMQGYLHQAEIAARELGVPLDANTKMLIDQSRELGIWKEAGKTANEKLLDGMSALVAKVGELVDRLNGVSTAITAIPTERHIRIIGDYVPPDLRDGGGGEPMPIGMAAGGAGHASGPMLFYTAGNEDYAFSGEGRRFGGTGAPSDEHGPVIVKQLEKLNQRLAFIDNLPADLARAVRDQMALSG